MAECAYCKAETQLYENGVPLCVICAEAQDSAQKPTANDREVRTILLREVFDTTTRLNAAFEEFNVIMSSVPSAMPHPDGSLRIRQASRELSAARKEMLQAHARLDEFLSRGVIPDDLKRLGGDAA
jgi:hypothetical protein